MTNTDKRAKAVITWFGFCLGAVALLALLGWLVWTAMSQVSPNVARIWALMATVLVPVGVYAGWRLGRLEARGRLDGIDQAINKVMGAASRTADLRVGTTRRLRRPALEAPAPNVPELPPVRVTHRRQGNEARIIEL
jgi:hypothetical protein